MNGKDVPRYRPERWWRVMNVSVFGSLAAVFTAMIIVDHDDDVWLIGGGVGLILISLVIVLRTARVGVVCTEDALIVHGVLWSRRIPRDAIIDIDTEPHETFVIWKGRGRLWRFTPLMMMWGGSGGWMPRSSRRERQRFLAKLARWAEQGQP